MFVKSIDSQRSSWHRLPLALFWVWIVLVNWRPIRSLDTMWQLATGRLMMLQRSIPHTDPFSSTCFGHAWINHEWLYELGLYGIYQLRGFSGILMMKVALIVWVFAFLDKRLKDQSVSLNGRILGMVFIFWGARLSRDGWDVRADLITLAFLSPLLWHLDRIRDRPFHSGSLWVWPFLFGLWSNLHGGFVAGLVIVWIYIVADWIESKQINRQSVAWALCCSLATLANPYGFHLHQSIRRGTLLLNAGFIQEWQKTPWLHMQMFWGALALLWLLVILTHRSLKRPVWVLLVSLFFSLSAVRVVRGVPSFMVCAFPFAIPSVYQFCLHRLSKYRLWKGKQVLGWLLSLGLGMASLAAASRMRGGITAPVLSKDACEFVNAHLRRSTFYNDYPIGSYWIWRFSGSPPVFIDGRYHMVDGYPELFQEMEWAKQRTPRDWSSFLDRKHVNAAMMVYPKDGPLPSVFEQYFPAAAWSLVYWDDYCLIYVKRIPLHEDIIHHYGFRVVLPDAQEGYVRWRLRHRLSERAKLEEELAVNLKRHPTSRRVQRLRELLEEAKHERS